jgi:hypothetical protein
MIVVGSQGQRSSLLGSIAADISRRAPCPVVVVPPGADIVRLGCGSHRRASDIGRNREGEDTSYNALMRWEWEGGTPGSVSEPDDTARPESALIGSRLERALLPDARTLASVEVRQVVPAAQPAELGVSDV